MELLRGFCVEVLRPVETGADAFGAPVTSDEPQVEVVENVLAHPGSTADLEAARPEGARVSMTFHFPKAYAAPLKGCSLAFMGRRYRVIGDPQPYAEELCPGAWNRAVEAEVVDG